MNKRFKTFITLGVAAAVVAATALVGVFAGRRFGRQLEIHLLEMTGPADRDGGQSILIKGDQNILIDTGNPAYSVNGTAAAVEEIFGGRIDVLILTSLAYEYNEGLSTFFTNTSFSKPTGIKTVYYPGYRSETAASDFFETARRADPLAAATVCSFKASIEDSDSGPCAPNIRVSADYQLSLLDTGNYLEEGTAVSAEEMSRHNGLFSLTKTGRDDFHLLLDGGLDRKAMYDFRSRYLGLEGRVSAWILSNPDLDVYLDTMYYEGFKPHTTIFTARPTNSTRPSLGTRPTLVQFQALLGVSGERIYTPLTMGSMKMTLNANADFKISGSEIRYYAGQNETENMPFIYSDLVMRNYNFIAAVKDILDIDLLKE